MAKKEIKHELIEQIGIIGRKESGWTKQFNLIRWGDHEMKYDLREWSPTGEPGKGVTLTKEEIENFRELMAEI